MADIDTYAQAVRRGKERLKAGPLATGAYYDKRRNRIVIELGPDSEFAFAPSRAQGLEAATSRDLSEIEIIPPGLGLHWPRLDADLYVPALLEGIFGSRIWIAKQLGQRGGRVKSASKAAASRTNGKQGGRPRKIAAPTQGDPDDRPRKNVNVIGGRLTIGHTKNVIINGDLITKPVPNKFVSNMEEIRKKVGRPRSAATDRKKGIV